MFEVSNTVLGAVMLLSTCGLMVGRRSLRVLTHSLVSRPIHTPIPAQKKAAMVELKVPLMSNFSGLVQQLKNDEIINKIVGERFDAYYIFIEVDDKSKLHHDGVVYEYMSQVYSKMWDEAVLIKFFGFECFVMSTCIHHAQLSTQREILQRDDVVAFYRPGAPGGPGRKEADGRNGGDDSARSGVSEELSVECTMSSINEERCRRGLVPVKVIDTITNITQTMDDHLRENQLLFFETSTDHDTLSCSTSKATSQFASGASTTNNSRIPTFKKVALGGTFDRIHNGHRKLLTLAAAVCSGTLVVGVTSDSMLAHKTNAAAISNFNTRKSNVENFVSVIKPSLPVDATILTDPFGPAIIDPEIEAIVVSSETIRGAFKINALRKEKGMKPLIVLVTFRGDSAVMSSSFVRQNAPPLT